MGADLRASEKDRGNWAVSTLIGLIADRISSSTSSEKENNLKNIKNQHVIIVKVFLQKYTVKNFCYSLLLPY